MSKNLEIHILQGFPTSNLNRDDVGSPKESMFGGVRRARVSSQCFKRAIRRQFSEGKLLAPEFLGTRSRLIIGLIKDRLIEDGMDIEDSLTVATLLVEKSTQAKVDAKKTTQVDTLLFLGKTEIDNLVEVGKKHFEYLAGVKKKDAIEKEITKEIEGALGSSKTVDLALFGRMMASAPVFNVDAACQVAHALGVSALTTDFDFFTAVDELADDSNTGAGMMGTLEFNSSVFYRYLNLNLNTLLDNLEDDQELTLEAAKALILATVRAMPTGKQSSTAAYSPPSLIMITVREDGVPISCAGAFEKPVKATHNGSITSEAILRLDEHIGRILKVYGRNGLVYAGVCTTEPVELNNLSTIERSSLDELVSEAVEALK